MAISRRRFITGTAASGAAAATLAACTRSDEPSYGEAVAETWRLPDLAAEGPDRLRGLVKAATLAANSHNTQPWRFRVEERRITIFPDRDRRTPVVDPDDHHLYASLGCAAENLAIAAEAAGFAAAVRHDLAADGVVVDLAPAAPRESPLFRAIARRQCTRAVYDGRAVPAGEVERLVAAGASDFVDVIALTETSRIGQVLDYIVAGNTAQLEDPAFFAELKQWIRFSEAEAVRMRDGLFAGASGNPTLPRWIAAPLLGLFLSAGSENEKTAEQMRSSAGILVFVAKGDGPSHWIETGRSVQRFALQATALGIRHAFLNQPVEVPAIRREFAQHLGLAGRRPDLIVRFGYGPEMPRSLRRPVEQVIV